MRRDQRHRWSRAGALLALTWAIAAGAAPPRWLARFTPRDGLACDVTEPWAHALARRGLAPVQLKLGAAQGDASRLELESAGVTQLARTLGSSTSCEVLAETAAAIVERWALDVRWTGDAGLWLPPSASTPARLGEGQPSDAGPTFRRSDDRASATDAGAPPGLPDGGDDHQLGGITSDAGSAPRGDGASRTGGRAGATPPRFEGPTPRDSSTRAGSGARAERPRPGDDRPPYTGGATSSSRQLLTHGTLPADRTPPRPGATATSADRDDRQPDGSSTTASRADDRQPTAEDVPPVSSPATSSPAMGDTLARAARRPPGGSAALRRRDAV